MTESPVLTREQEALLAMLVKARREAGPEYTAGFRAPLFLGKDRLPLHYRGFPVEGREVALEDLYALADAGFVVLYKSGFTDVLRVDLTRAAFTDPEEQKLLAA